MLHLADGRRMSSTLVETVSINYEDFNDSFLTCGTCLCMYDGQEHTPKLLPCSHTVCRSCLERIIDAQNRDSPTFRCPICRETITIPRGGVGSFPPSFIVNQLLDLMARQRRDIIPKCSNHPSQELMFCETCDTVFCTLCTGGSHNGRGASAHTVIPFSIAIKRMSEILLYKASLCMRNLNSASDVVNDEMTKLDMNAEKCMDTVSKTFQDLVNLMDQRRLDVMEMVARIRDEKKKVLREQLDIIEAEKTKVQNDCHGLQHQIEVRSITKKISDLNEKLDMSTTLSEPRENAFMRFEYKHNSSLCDLMNALNAFGCIKISKTFPALCTAKIEKAVTHLQTVATVSTVDYHGNPRTTGSDPVVAELRSDRGVKTSVEIKDRDDGTYTIHFTPTTTGVHKLCISIFDRPIRESPFIIEVTDHNNPQLKIGKRGCGNMEFTQPVQAVIDRHDNIYILDTGNSRIKVLDTECQFVRHTSHLGLEQHSGTGMALAPNNNLVVVNWRTKYVTEINHQGDVVKKFTTTEFVEPISVTVNKHGEIIVADNGAGRLFVFNSAGQMINKIGSKGDKPGQFKLISNVCSGPNDEILVTDSRLQVFRRNGSFSHEISADTKVKGQYGGVTIDGSGWILASRSEKGKSFVQVFNNSGKWVFNIDSHDDKLKRPSGLATFSNGRVLVVDLGNDCVKVFRYK